MNHGQVVILYFIHSPVLQLMRLSLFKKPPLHSKMELTHIKHQRADTLNNLISTMNVNIIKRLSYQCGFMAIHICNNELI